MQKIILLPVLALLASCATYHAEPLAPDRMLAAYEARNLNDPHLRQYIATHSDRSDTGWTPDTLTLAAFYYSTELDAARARYSASQAAIESAGERPNPTLSLPTQYTAATSKPWTYGLALDIPIETAGKRGYRVAQAQQLSSAAQLAIGQAAWQVRSQLRTALLDLFASHQREDLLQRQVTLQQELLAMTEQRARLGEMAPTEANQQRMALMRTENDLAAAHQSGLDARSRAAAAIGIPLPALEAISPDFSQFERAAPAIPADSVRRAAILNRTDLRAALDDYEASQSALQLEIARQYPNLSLGLGYSFDQGQDKYSLTPGVVNLPLFNHNQGAIAQAEAQRKEAAIKVEALQEQAINAGAAALRNYDAARHRLSLLDRLAANQSAAREADQRAFASGEMDRLALRQADLAASLDALSRLDARVQMQQALLQLENALQRPLQDNHRPLFTDSGDRRP
ncbi:TolC family protein [Pseudomonas sp. LA21]|uniref:TolC family protein n=1 Tax=unclassified Pseudomonas TaxID=196821 RepID=UPI001FB773B4|nr:TolC family protein [Pseudomonas sp. LA21]MCJ1886533.1 TolC family protein [Pseudomonas sp. LA21]